MHATKIVAAVLDVETGELQCFGMSADIEKAAGFCAALPGPVRVAYEAGSDRVPDGERRALRR